jgi:glutathione S-transferase
MNMAWVELVSLLALVQYVAFGFRVGTAREKFGVKAPAMSGNETFERYNRVHMNTLEQLVVFLPALWIAAQYSNPARMAAIGAVFIIGRQLYLHRYVSDPQKRGLGFGVSFLSMTVLVIYALFGVIRSLLQ